MWNVDTHLCGNILFSSSAVAQILTTFDVFYSPQAQARFEVYGTRGTIAVPDPDTFGGPMLLLRRRTRPRPQRPTRRFSARPCRTSTRVIRRSR